MNRLPGSVLRQLKSLAPGLEPLVTVGKSGVTEQVMEVLNDALTRRELVKVRFTAFKEEKKQLSQQLAENTQSFIVARVGNVLVLFRQNEDPDKRVISVKI